MPAAPSLLTLERGFRFAPLRIPLDFHTVERYRSAVKAFSPAYEDGQLRLVPPLAAMAFALREVLNQIQLPPGALHSSQEFEAHQALPEGTILLCDAIISQRTVRGGWLFLNIDFVANVESNGKPALSARTSVMIPQEA